MILDPRERYMKKKMQEEYEEKLKELKQANNKKLKEIAKKLKEEKIPIETITKTTGLTEKEIQNPWRNLS